MLAFAAPQAAPRPDEMTCPAQWAAAGAVRPGTIRNSLDRYQIGTLFVNPHGGKWVRRVVRWTRDTGSNRAGVESGRRVTFGPADRRPGRRTLQAGRRWNGKQHR